MWGPSRQASITGTNLSDCQSSGRVAAIFSGRWRSRQNDPNRAGHEAVLHAWHECYGPEKKILADVVADLKLDVSGPAGELPPEKKALRESLVEVLSSKATARYAAQVGYWQKTSETYPLGGSNFVGAKSLRSADTSGGWCRPTVVMVTMVMMVMIIQTKRKK